MRQFLKSFFPMLSLWFSWVSLSGHFAPSGWNSMPSSVHWNACTMCRQCRTQKVLQKYVLKRRLLQMLSFLPASGSRTWRHSSYW